METFTKNKPVVKETREEKQEQRSLLPSSLFPILIILIMAWRGIPFLDGNASEIPELGKKRKEELDRRIKELDEGGEQYALLARTSGWFPCYSCVGTDSIWLTSLQVWRYGSTIRKTNGEKLMEGKAGGRYTDSYLEKYKLWYVVQYEGSYLEARKEELRKIYNYARLPENYIRAIPLIRPPGNKRDI